jgi:hypothetical protein
MSVATARAEEENSKPMGPAGLVRRGGRWAAPERVRSTPSTLRDRLATLHDDVADAAELASYLARGTAHAKWEDVDERLGLDESLGEESGTYAAMEGTFVRVVSSAVTLIIGIYVFAEISGTMPTPENSNLANATDAVLNTTGSAFQLGAVAVIVLVAALILSLVGGFGMNGGRR